MSKRICTTEPRVISLIASKSFRGNNMASFIIRDVDERIAQALRKRAAHHGRSTEAELRVLLEEALVYKKRSFADFLLTFPNVGKDDDFNRINDSERDL